MAFLFVPARRATRSMVRPAYPDAVSSSMAAPRMACSRTAPRRLGEGIRLWYSTVRTVLYSGRATAMRAKGMGYDTGFSIGGSTGRPVEPPIVHRELQIIRDDLHCTAVRLIGNDLARMEVAAQYAADLGLEVWFSPYPMELDRSQ